MSIISGAWIEASGILLGTDGAAVETNKNKLNLLVLELILIFCIA